MSVFRSGLVIMVAELVWLALMKGYQIRSVMASAKVGDPGLACTIIEEVLPPSADLLSMN